MKERVFYSVHYGLDSWRSAQIRNMGVLEGNEPATDNEWEEIKGSDEKIKEWIKEQLKGCSCTVVLIGKETANRKWIKYEIIESWKAGMGIIGIYIHGLKDKDGNTTTQGDNPFNSIFLKDGSKLSSIVKCYNPSGKNSKAIYKEIFNNIASQVEEAI